MRKRGESTSRDWVVGALAAIAAMSSVGCAQATTKPPVNTLIVATSIGETQTEEATTVADPASAPVGLSAIPLEPAPVYAPVVSQPAAASLASADAPTPPSENWWRSVWRAK